MVRQHAPRRAPRWAVVTAVVGAILMVVAGGLVVAGEWLVARYDLEQRDLFGEAEVEFGEDVEGPLNVLLVGIDTRPSRPDEPGRADSIMLVHVDESLQRGYLISLPRDLRVDIPPFPATGYDGGQDRLNAAMAFGSRPVAGEDLPNLDRGFALLAETVKDLTGIERWDAGAVIDFEGFVSVVDAMGGVTMELDERIVSEHRQPDGSHRPLSGDGQGFVGPQAEYEPGEHHLEGWQALDIARQRYSVDDGDFGRQRNQQLLVRAIMDRAFSQDLVSDPVAMDRTIRAAGDSLVFDGRGHGAIDFAFALRDLRPEALDMVRLPTRGVGAGDAYQGEELEPEAEDLFRALRQDRLDAYLAEHRDLME